MLFNQNIRYVWPKFHQFSVETGYDYLEIMTAAGQRLYTGITSSDPHYPPIDSWEGPLYTYGNGSSTSYLDFLWSTDYSIAAAGYNITEMLLACGGATYEPQNTLEVQRNYPHDGFFVGDHDVIYVKVKQPAGYKMSLLLWPLADSDFDIYASTSCPLPSNTCFSYSGVRPGRAPELVVIPAFGSVGGGERWIYIALGSHSGTGQFRFYANIHGGYNSQRTASTDWTPTPTIKQYIRRILHKMSVATYLATEGRFLIDSWVVHWNDPGFGMFRFQDYQTENSACMGTSVSNPGTTCWSHPGYTWVRLKTAQWCNCAPASSCGCYPTEWYAESAASDLLLHEFGHCDDAFGLRDEYMSTHGCGHSIMGANGYSSNATDFCNSYNGGKDHSPGHSSAEHNWACFPSKLYLNAPVFPPVPTAETPDAFYRLGGEGNGDFDMVVSIFETQY